MTPAQAKAMTENHRELMEAFEDLLDIAWTQRQVHKFGLRIEAGRMALARARQLHSDDGGGE